MNSARFIAALALAGCASFDSSSFGRSAQDDGLPYMRSDVAMRELAGTGAGKIQHIVYIVQENRSFDNLFQGYPGADTVSQRQNFGWDDGETHGGPAHRFVRDRPFGRMRCSLRATARERCPGPIAG